MNPMIHGAANPMPESPVHDTKRGYNRLLLLVTGLGGLLYGVDVGIIGGALPYLEATSHLNAGQLSIIVAAVLLGSVISTMFAGVLSDWIGRRPLMTLSGVTFVLSIPIIALSHGYGPLFFGRLLQGCSGGLIGVVVPLYLAECLPASHRGKGTGMFQFLLTLGIVAAAIIGIYYSYRVDALARIANPGAVFSFKDQAWRRIFWVSLPPGILFVLGSLFVAESPRWLFLRGKRELAYRALLRSRTTLQADIELQEMEQIALAAQSASIFHNNKEPLLSRKFVVPFLISCVILFCNTATGISSLIGYNTNILLQSGLSDLRAHWGYVLFTFFNFAMTFAGMALVDRKGRRFLFILGTSGIIVSLIGVGALFLRTERLNVDCHTVVQSLIKPDQTLNLRFDAAEARRLLAANGHGGDIQNNRASLVIVYSYGDFTGASNFVRSDDPGATPIRITRESGVPGSAIEAFFKDPFANLDRARTAPLKIKHAVIGAVPSALHGRLVAIGLYIFIAFYAVGPGMCVWLALSELMPTRIRSNGMSIALVINQLVATTIAGVFLPVVSKYGYSTMFFMFAGFTVIYLLTVVFFLPETRGKTLEEIEQYFDTRKGNLARTRYSSSA